MSDLILDSLEIKNVRLFKHLEIERLGRVNLIVGKNGVGKTSLLEAIRIYAYRAFPTVIMNMLRSRNEINFEMVRSKVDSEGEVWYLALRHLFYGRPDLFKEEPEFQLGPVPAKDKEETLFVDFRDVRSGFVSSRGGFVDPIGSFLRVRRGGIDFLQDLVAEKETEEPGYPLDTNLEDYAPLWRAYGLDEVSCLFISAIGLDDNNIVDMWEEALLAGREDAVLDVLHVILQEVQRFNITPGSLKVPVVKMRNLTYPVPLRSLGEGMNRMLGIALALVNAKDGILLIDEVESGLHYSVQPDMWRLVFETAAKLNVQVFATTHSLDCIRAFESATSERGEEESLLISLRRHHDEPEKIVAVLADKSDLVSIVRSHIEVR